VKQKSKRGTLLVDTWRLCVISTPISQGGWWYCEVRLQGQTIHVTGCFPYPGNAVSAASDWIAELKRGVAL
jgi:hypothetical protein